MSTLPQLEEKIYSLVPELKELTPWCFIKTKKLEWTFKIIFICPSWNLLCDSLVRTTTTVERKNIIEIIGHEIHPHHWLPLLKEKKWCITAWWLFFKVKLSNWYDTLDEVELTDIRYDFKKSFKDQSPEFHNFLILNI